MKNAEQCGEEGLPGTMLTSFNLCLTFTNNRKLGFSGYIKHFRFYLSFQG